MGIRLNKVLQELNVGTETVVEFLKSMPGLEPEKDMNPNTKVTDAQYEALCKRFHGDKVVKEKASTFFPVGRKEFKPSIHITDDKGIDVKVVGKIDLDSLNQATRPKRKSKEEKRVEREDKSVEKPKRIRKRNTSSEGKHPAEKLSTDTANVTKSTLRETQNTIKKNSIPVGSSSVYIDESAKDPKEYVLFSSLTFDEYRAVLKFKKHYYIHEDLKISNYRQIVNDYIKSLKYSEWKQFKNFHIMVSINKESGKFEFVDFNLHDFIKALKEKTRISKEKKQGKKSIYLSRLRYGSGIARIKYDGVIYKYRNGNIKDFNAIIGQYLQNCTSLERSFYDEFTVSVVLDKQNRSFNFKDFDLIEYVKNLNSHTISRIKNLSEGKSSKSISPQSHECLLSIENIEFFDGYYFVWIVKSGKNITSITPLKIYDINSYVCLRYVQKYFSERFPQGLIAYYTDKAVLKLNKPYMLSNYVRILHDNMDVKGEWWEEVQNIRKRTLAQCHIELNTDVKRKAIKAKNDYLYNLSNLQNDKKLIRVYEINHGKEEDAFIFTITMPNDRCAVIFENASNDASTTTWVFVAKNEDYEACVNLVFDYFTDYMISSKRSSLRDANTNPPYKFKAESYTFADHNDLGQWLRKMDKILERTSHRDTIEFVPGLNIPQTTNIRTGHTETITTKSIHNELMQKLYDKLCQEYGEKNVGTEVRVGTRRIDAVVKGSDCFDIYEVKADPNPFNCVTEALGQICQYAYLYCRDKIGRMVIVGSSATTSEVENYLSWFREKHSLQVYYKPV